MWAKFIAWLNRDDFAFDPEYDRARNDAEQMVHANILAVGLNDESVGG